MNTDNRVAIVEQKLSDYALDWTLADVDLTHIDTTASQGMQNRGKLKIDQENVIAMAITLDTSPDHVLPRIVVARLNGRLVIVDGNHRAAAYKMAERTHAPAYLIEDAPPETVEALILSANAANGRGLAADERLAQAIRYADLTGDNGIAAREFGFRPETFATKRRAEQGRDKARRAAGVKSAMPDAKAEQLNRLGESELRTIGRELIENADTRTIDAAVKNVLAVDPGDRAMQLREEVGRIAQAIKDRKTPAGRTRAKNTGPTLIGARQQLKRITAQVAANPSWRTDPALVALVDTLAKEVRHAAAGQHAA